MAVSDPFYAMNVKTSVSQQNSVEFSNEEESIPFLDNQDNASVDTPEWDLYLNEEPEDEDESTHYKKFEIYKKILKAAIYAISFVIVLCSCVISKGTLLFITSHIRNQSHQLCTDDLNLDKDKNYEVNLTDSERQAWIWCLISVLIVPECFIFFRSLRLCFFKSYKIPSWYTATMVFTMETFHSVGLVLIMIVILPELSAIKSVMLTNCVCILPAFMNFLSTFSKVKVNDKFWIAKAVLDSLSLAAQLSGLLWWLLTSSQAKSLWSMPIALLLVSCGWWENYVDEEGISNRFVQKLIQMKREIEDSRCLIYVFVPVWKSITVLSIITIYLVINEGTSFTHSFFINFSEGFLSRLLNATWTPNKEGRTFYKYSETIIPLNIFSDGLAPLYICLIQISFSFIAYVFARFACKICIQGFSFSLPISLTVPVTLSMLASACQAKANNLCFGKAVSYYLFWSCDLEDMSAYLIWMAWLLSQSWTVMHIWSPKCERMASTEKLFVNPMYCGALIDQSLALNRRRIETNDLLEDDLQEKNNENQTNFYENIEPMNTTRIYACATMWHETKEEMVQLLKSVMRMDIDQRAKYQARYLFHSEVSDYYVFEAHIFFDDAFELNDEGNDVLVNSYVKLLVEVIDDAARAIYNSELHLDPPTKIPTPYGGQLVWILPGLNKVTAHLKNKYLIRHKKRWSQVMYMYYFLGHRLLEATSNIFMRDIIAENTYILALDGDVNFQASAIQLLVDLMKKNPSLGAACGRIHPVGSGVMANYQKFEYAIGHWLQKATEHMIGCVLCSPGCFSLFRGKALMDNNVMKKYTTKSNEALHYIQFDQGEDRWLCTLLLQRGYRVEYSAASDAYTQCPEGFGEFYNQRRRWAPSTMANILDLLQNYKNTVACNDNISMIYIWYQAMLMIGTILGPGTIFLMLVGAGTAAFRISNIYSFTLNIIPITFFILICFFTKDNVQILIAQILSAGYALLMMAVLVGTAIQLVEDGIGAPSAIFLISLASSFVIAALIHPQEFWCVLHGILYFISIPSMYLLLALYSFINLNVVSWGTREVPKKKTKKEEEEEKMKQEETKKKKKPPFSWLGFNSRDDEEGGFSIGISNIFRCLCCTTPKPSDEKVLLVKVNDSLDVMSKKINNLEYKLCKSSPQSTFRKKSLNYSTRRENEILQVVNECQEEEINDDDNDSNTEEQENVTGKEERDNLRNPYWIEDEDLKDGNVKYLSSSEIKFWKELIAKYLYPLDQNKEKEAKVAAELKYLRNKVVFSFLMFNAIFVLIVFLLQMNKEILHINWPLGADSNITYIPANKQIIIVINYMQLEPVGLVFALFFAVILVVQFFGMIFHRLETLAHILSSTELNFCSSKFESDNDGDNTLKKNGVMIAKKLQSMKHINEENCDKNKNWKNVSERRPTLAVLHQKRQKKKSKIKTLDAALLKRINSLDVINEEGGATLNFLGKKRRSTVMALNNKWDSYQRSLTPASTPHGDTLSIASSELHRKLDFEFGDALSVNGVINNGFLDDG